MDVVSIAGLLNAIREVTGSHSRPSVGSRAAEGLRRCRGGESVGTHGAEVTCDLNECLKRINDRSHEGLWWMEAVRNVLVEITRLLHMSLSVPLISRIHSFTVLLSAWVWPTGISSMFGLVNILVYLFF